MVICLHATVMCHADNIHRSGTSIFSARPTHIQKLLIPYFSQYMGTSKHVLQINIPQRNSVRYTVSKLNNQ